MNPTNDNHQPRLISPKDAAAATSLSRTLLMMMAEAGQFPKPVKLGVKRMAFVRTEVEEWIESRIVARDVTHQSS